MRLSDLRDKSVVSVEGAVKVGSVEDVFADAKDWSIAGVRIKPPAGGPGYIAIGDAIQSIGPDAVTVPTRDALRPLDRTQVPPDLVSLNEVVNSKVVTEGGELLGTITGVEIDVDGRRVHAFEYASGPLAALFRRQHDFAPGLVVGVGPGMLTVRESARPSREAGA